MSNIVYSCFDQKIIYMWMVLYPFNTMLIIFSQIVSNDQKLYINISETKKNKMNTIPSL
jgi:hypothetical protein